MNRKNFFKNIGALTFGVLLAPNMLFSGSTNQQININTATVYKIDRPVAIMSYVDDNNQNPYIEPKSHKFAVQTYNCSLEQLCRKNPNANIFYYTSGEYNYPDLNNGKPIPYVRAYINRIPNIKIIGAKSITIKKYNSYG